MENTEVEKIIQKLRKKEIKISEVPEEIENNLELVTFERKIGIRKIDRKGFDIISNSFFVEEIFININANIVGKKEKKVTFFNNFNDFYNFLNGDIYENACYTFCPLFKDKENLKNLDLVKMMNRESFIDYTIEDFSLSLSNDEREAYEQGKQIHRLCQQWSKKFIDCNNSDELKNIIKKYKNSKLCSNVKIEFFIFQYIFSNCKKEKLSNIVKIMADDDFYDCEIIKSLCIIYEPKDVMNCLYEHFAIEGVMNKKIKEIKKFIYILEEKKIDFKSIAFFDKKSHYYCEKILGYFTDVSPFPIVKTYRYFDTFSKFIEYRNGNLLNCDLSGALDLEYDFSNFIIDKTTKLPINSNEKYNYLVNKYYYNGKFYVEQQWRNLSNCLIKEYRNSFDYFFDFVAFLKGDLSNANLQLCDGLVFLEKQNTIKFSNAKMKSSLCEKFGLKYEGKEINYNLIKSFECIEKNESETNTIHKSSLDLTAEAIGKDLLPFEISIDYKCQRVHYISDIHILHKIKKSKCYSQEDIINLIQKKVAIIGEEAGTLLLINGDVSSDFEIFKLFVEILSKMVSEKTSVIFTLGNHELWPFSNTPMEQIVLKYRELLEKHNMYLLQNDLLYCDRLPYYDIKKMEYI